MYTLERRDGALFVWFSFTLGYSSREIDDWRNFFPVERKGRELAPSFQTGRTARRRRWPGAAYTQLRTAGSTGRDIDLSGLG